MRTKPLLAADPQRLGAQVGFTAILHTWGQNLLFHPHLHCVVTGGGLAPDGQCWVAGPCGRTSWKIPRRGGGELRFFNTLPIVSIE